MKYEIEDIEELRGQLVGLQKRVEELEWRTATHYEELENLKKRCDRMPFMLPPF